MRSKKPRTSRRQRRLPLLLWVILLLVLIGSTACRTTVESEHIDPTKVYREQVAELVPEHPTMPDFPALSWEYAEGRYSIEEADVDKLLDYRDNQLPEYLIQVEVFTDQLEIIIRELKGE